MENVSFPVKRLTKDEFASAIEKGLGRAMLHVVEYGLDDVEDLVLDACLHNKSYDPQCESSKAPWLFKMFSNSAQYPRFRVAILDSLKTETNDHNLWQLMKLAFAMAQHGDQVVQQAIKTVVLKDADDPKSEYNWINSDKWLDLEGIPGFLELARIYGRRLLKNPDDSIPETYSFRDKQELKDILIQYSLLEPEIKAYRDYLESQGDWNPDPPDSEEDHIQYRERCRHEYSLERVLNDASNKIGKYPGDYRSFARHATPEELLEVYNRLLNEPDPEIQLRLLWVFIRTPLPKLNEIFFHWASGTNHEMRRAAIAALAQVADDRVHELARSKTAAGQLLGSDREALGLFLNNYEPADAQIILHALDSLLPDRESAHSLASDVLELAEKYEDVGLVPALLWSYQNTPCTICRKSAVVELDCADELSDEIRNECLYDANPDLREYLTGESSE